MYRAIQRPRVAASFASRLRHHHWQQQPSPCAVRSISTNAAVEANEMTEAQSNVHAQRMVKFLNYAWTPYHAVEAMSKKLLAAGFKHIKEADSWDIQAGGKYFFTRNMSSIVAFAVGKQYAAGGPVYMVGAHTDSPCLKLKPKSKLEKGGCAMVNVETYGGGLWTTWFDRDLSVAGRLLVEAPRETPGSNPKWMHKLVRIDKPIMRIPMLAIHLNRKINSDGFKPNTQNELIPLLASQANAEAASSGNGSKAAAATSDSDAKADGNGASPGGPCTATCDSRLLRLLAAQAGCEPEAIVDMELNVCDTQPSQLGGADDEFVFSGRLDNLAMCWCSMQALIDSSGSLDGESAVRAVALFDHEEVGSSSTVGAGGPLMRDAIVRITTALAGGSPGDAVERCLQRSFLVSADMAHGLHPNYQEQHERDHQPKFHRGLVIKYNQNQRYATNAVTAALFQQVAKGAGIPCQMFVVRNDMPCGSTIGPILASGLGVRTVDVGVAQFSMHSIREMCGTRDIEHAYLHFKAYFEGFGEVDARLDVDALVVEPDGTIDDVACGCLE